MVIAVWGPEVLTKYHDRMVLNRIASKSIESESEGYRYALSSNEKLYILSRCLNSRTLPESDQSALTRVENSESDYQNLTGAYAFVENYKEPSEQEITEEEIFESCNRSMELLEELGILPGRVKEIKSQAYEAVLYSAIDVLEPRNNLAVWEVSLTTDTRNADKSGKLIDACIDADTGKFYEFYIRTDTTWEKLDADGIMEKWSEYMGLTGGERCEDVNPLEETTPYFVKYSFPGGEGSTVVTIGFYEGINELFLKVAR
ncbi:MAG: hypothetical protein IJZ34_12875 [Lachnospiraceae bacterium]|nr:hypothetical protein [Lachnospiraceae bacterium]